MRLVSGASWGEGSSSRGGSAAPCGPPVAAVSGGPPVAAVLHGLPIRTSLAGVGPTPPATLDQPTGVRSSGASQPIVVDAARDIGGGRSCTTRDAPLVVHVASSGPVPRSVPSGRLILDTEVAGQRLHWAVERSSGWLLRVPEVADFAITADTTEVEVRADPAVGEDAVVLLVRGLLLAFVLVLRGHCVLHASAVETDTSGGAVAFAGPSGTGKSTLAAACCALGRPFVTDDLLRVDVGERPPRWVGTAAELRVRPGARRFAVGHGWQQRTTPDGRIGVHPPATERHAGPLRAIVVPRPVARGPIAARRLSEVEATLRLMGAGRLPRWLDRGVMAQHLAAAATLAETVPVLEVAVPWDDAAPPAVARDILRAVDLCARGVSGDGR
jgi:hypothetical protein